MKNNKKKKNNVNVMIAQCPICGKWVKFYEDLNDPEPCMYGDDEFAYMSAYCGSCDKDFDIIVGEVYH